jgi:hypothetical protein
MTESDVVPDEWVERCFEGEADRILALLRNTRKKRRGVGDRSPVPVGAFPLPDFKELTQLSEQERGSTPPAKGGKVSKIWVRLKTVSKSREDLIVKLPEEWKQSATVS